MEKIKYTDLDFKKEYEELGKIADNSLKGAIKKR